MKKLIVPFSLLFAIIGLISSCDKVKNPYPTTLGGGSATGLIWDDSSESVLNNNQRFLLLEEFTGHTCSNCPPASAKAQQYREDYSPSLVVVAIHTGVFAEKKANSDKYQTDFTTPLGEDLRTTFAPKSYPRAMINRIEDNAEWAFRSNVWKGHIDDMINTPAIANIYIKNRYDDSTGTIQSELIVNMVKDYNEDLNIQMVIIEEKIIDWQLDVDGTTNIPDYEHNHVLRAAINGIYGEKLAISDAGQSDTLIYNYQIPDNVLDINNCMVVAFISKPGPDDFEVMQVNEAHITSNHP